MFISVVFERGVSHLRVGILCNVQVQSDISWSPFSTTGDRNHVHRSITVAGSVARVSEVVASQTFLLLSFAETVTSFYCFFEWEITPKRAKFSGAWRRTKTICSDSKTICSDWHRISPICQISRNPCFSDRKVKGIPFTLQTLSAVQIIIYFPFNFIPAEGRLSVRHIAGWNRPCW